MACVRVGAVSAFSSPRRVSPYARPARLSNNGSSSTSNSTSNSSPARRRRIQKSLSVDLACTVDSDPSSHKSRGPRLAAYPFSAPALSSSSSSSSTSPFPWPNSPPASSSSTAPTVTSSHQEPSGPPLSPSYTLITPHLAIADLDFAENEEQLRRAGVTHVVSVVGGRVHIPEHIPPTHRLHVPLSDAPFAELVGALGPVVDWVGDVLRAAGVLLSPDFELELGEEGEGVAKKRGEKDVRILVHCAQGISRSPAVSAALLVALPLVSTDDDEAVSEFPNTRDSSHELLNTATSGLGSRSGLVSSSPQSISVRPQRPLRRALSAPAALAYIAARRPVADPNWGFRAQLGEWERVCRAGSESSGVPE
ncbi:protein-tyrosine phosphatase-like protein [Roridomyces roridus]|uniref:Protein-tyrosine phosphatase-like protein n=1 Tax=Roridomyces roridus TaxID=1738132 RepID=A0AAD7BNS1_9AGAR|nr:protein-tyrosine phosphatase-like protein [Roridomyces roridus]